MEIEENKYIVTWCLDREGPRICLRAVTGQGHFKRIEITSENFELDFDVEEAHAFLDIINQLGVAQEDKFVVSEPITTPEVLSPEVSEVTPASDVPPVISESSLTPEVAVFADTETSFKTEIHPVTPEVAPPESAPNEILQILKQSEETIQDPFSDSIKDLPIEETVHHDEIENISLERTPIQEPTEISPSDIETASFFRTSETKTPLEMLLEEDSEKEQESIQVSEPPQAELEESLETALDYTPDDLKTELFFSKFDSNRTLDLIKEKEFEYKPETQQEPKRAVELSPASTPEKKEEFMSAEERRAAIEKERAERRRRLWELTRGF